MLRFYTEHLQKLTSSKIICLSVICLIFVLSCNEPVKEKKQKTIPKILYQLEEVKPKRIPGYTFNYPTFNYWLEFTLSSDEKHAYKGNVKSVSEYAKLSDDAYRRFAHEIVYNKKGYEIEYNHKYGQYQSFYDKHQNLIRRLNISEGDTVYDYKFTYNKHRQMISFHSRNPDNDSNRYDLFISIEYDEKGYPVLLKNEHPNRLYAYKKIIEYEDNIVTISKVRDTVKRFEEELIYSEEGRLVSHTEADGSTLLEFYNDEGYVNKRMYFNRGAYTRTMEFTLNEYGDPVKDETSNYHQEGLQVTNISYKYDSIGNKIYEKFFYEYRQEEFEQFFDFTYHDD